MKNSPVFGADLQDFFAPADLNRREFLKTGVKLAGVAAGLEMIAGCAAADTRQGRIIPAKEKSNCKIYPAQKGCLVGFYKDQNKRFRIGKQISATIDHYGNHLGANPAIIAFWTFLDLGFPAKEAGTIKEYGIIPYINIMPGHEKWHRSYSPNDVVQGRCDGYLKKLAEDALAFGEKHGGFFLRPWLNSMPAGGNGVENSIQPRPGDIFGRYSKDREQTNTQPGSGRHLVR